MEYEKGCRYQKETRQSAGRCDGPASPLSESRRFLGQYFVAGILLTAVLLAHTALFRGYITDDAFISFRYLKHLSDGNGLVYNVGERVWGFTNFLWMMILFPFERIGVHPLLASRTVGVFCNIVSLLVVLRSPLSARSGGSKWNLLGGMLLISHSSFVLQGLGGLETSCTTLLILLVFCVFNRARETERNSVYYSLGVVMSLTVLARPESIFVFAVMIVGFMTYHRRGGLFLRRPLYLLLLGFLPVVVLYELCMFLYYGVFWPNSINAKIGLSLEQILRGVWYYKEFVIRYPMHIILLIMTGCLIRKNSLLVRTVFHVCLLMIVFAIVVGGDWMFGYRLLHSLMPLTCMLIPFIVTMIRDKGFSDKPRACRIWETLLIAGIILSIMINFMSWRWDPHVSGAREKSYVHDGIVVGKWMKEHFRSDAVLATNTGGTVAYYSELPIIDMLGINNLAIARRRHVPVEWKGIEKGDGEYVLSRRPDYIQFGSSTGSAEPVFLSDIEIYESPAFWRDYELVEYPISGEIRLLIYKRRMEPRSTELSKGELKRIQEVAKRRMQRSAFRY